jgi:hypothetical protein
VISVSVTLNGGYRMAAARRFPASPDTATSLQ